ncbi:uncharacterized protein L201_000609 [Kwoniella dendrophila CBS 6074]|uniref:Ornithine cyclodeaminase n=1 Tax=Kwoniella dendrophila CBS 6074 TaxID=1295534 RepID=A0AAX4JLF6_9TREE
MSTIRILTSNDVDKVLDNLSPELAIKSQAHLFELFSRAEALKDTQGHNVIQTPHRITVSSEDSTMLFMPSRAPTISSSSSSNENGRGNNTTSIKIVSVPNGSGADGLPATTLVMNEKTGKVKAIVNARKLTALRNACGSALFLQQFPNPTPPKHLVLFGSGAQCYSHTILFLKLYSSSLKNVTFVIRSLTPRAEKVIKDLSSKFPQVKFELAVHASAESEGLNEVVKKGDIIVTATSSTKPLFKSDSSTPGKGSRLILIGSYKPTMKEIDSNLTKNSSLLVVDSKDACLRESGELIESNIQKDQLVELGETLNKEYEIKSHNNDDDIIIFKSVGLGIQDVAITNLVVEEAEKLSLGNIIENYD